MSLFNEPEAEEKEPEASGGSNGGVFLIFLAIVLPVYFVIRHVAGPDRAYTASLCLFTIMVVIGICWNLRSRLWFWGVMLVVAGLHVPLVVMVQWPHYWIPGIALLPIGLVDVLIVVKVVRFIEKFIVKSASPDEEG
jgi:hypothetical protein